MFFQSNFLKFYPVADCDLSSTVALSTVAPSMGLSKFVHQGQPLTLQLIRNETLDNAGFWARITVQGSDYQNRLINTQNVFVLNSFTKKSPNSNG